MDSFMQMLPSSCENKIVQNKTNPRERKIIAHQKSRTHIVNEGEGKKAIETNPKNKSHKVSKPQVNSQFPIPNKKTKSPIINLFSPFMKKCSKLNSEFFFFYMKDRNS